MSKPLVASHALEANLYNWDAARREVETWVRRRWPDLPFQVIEDVVQTSIIQIIERSRKEGRPPKNWVAAICAYVRLNLKNDHRTKVRRAEVELAEELLEVLPSNEGSPEKQLEENDFAGLMTKCSLALSEALRRVFVLRYIVGLSPAEVAAETGLTIGSVNVSLNRANKKVRTILIDMGYSVE